MKVDWAPASEVVEELRGRDLNATGRWGNEQEVHGAFEKLSLVVWCRCCAADGLEGNSGEHNSEATGRVISTIAHAGEWRTGTDHAMLQQRPDAPVTEVTAFT
ncbi:MAG UNVERIFIED_CONTAM: hypothetical protein LVR18_27005 [Planctomycetaceae bacterium]